MEIVADFGEKLEGSLAYFDPDSLSWKTCGGLFAEDFPESSWNLLKSGMMHSGKLYPLSPLVRPISEKGYFWWPTPAAQNPQISLAQLTDKDGNEPEHLNQRLYNKKTGRLAQKGLEQAVIFPTPKAGEGKRTDSPSERERRSPSLETMVLGNQTVWPTPDANMGNRGTYRDKTIKKRPSGYYRQKSLNDAVELVAEQEQREIFPTPTVSGNHNRKGVSPDSGDGLATVVLASLSDSDPAPSSKPRLSPDWVEALMGFPIGFTDTSGELLPLRLFKTLSIIYAKTGTPDFPNTSSDLAESQAEPT